MEKPIQRVLVMVRRGKGGIRSVVVDGHLVGRIVDEMPQMKVHRGGARRGRTGRQIFSAHSAGGGRRGNPVQIFDT